MSRESNLGNPVGPGLFSDILNYNYAESPNKRESLHSDSQNNKSGQ